VDLTNSFGDSCCTHSSRLSLHHKRHSWIFSCLRKADKNKDNKMTQSELKNFLRLINIKVDDDHAEMLFKVAPSELFEGFLHVGIPSRCHDVRLERMITF